MEDFFKSQMDFIFFGYGLSLILLGPLSHFLNRRTQCRLSWVWLGLFGVAQGLNEWLELLSLSLGSDFFFDLAKLGLITISFVFLVEFGRAGTLTLLGRGPGRWILAALLGVALLGAMAGTKGFFATGRYALGLVGGLWAAGVIYLASKSTGPGKLALLGAALGMTSNALVTGLVSSPAHFFPASWLNTTSFLNVTGLPIQVVQGLLAFWIVGCLVLFCQASLEQQVESRIRIWTRNLILGATIAMIVMLMIGWSTTQYLGEEANYNIRTDQENLARIIYQTLQDDMKETDHLVSAMAASTLVSLALENRSVQAIDQANLLLDSFSKILPGAVCYLMAREGLTLASSNRHLTDSFVGKSYRFRPYFQQAVKGAPGKYWARGVTSKELGYLIIHLAPHMLLWSYKDKQQGYD
jgi:hypothetical protein